MDRREAIRLLGVSFGGATLITACSSDNNPVGPTPPGYANAYRFFAIKAAGSLLPGGGQLGTFRYDVCIDSAGEILYGALDGDDPGVYGVNLAFNGANAPRVLAERTLAKEGDILSDGRRILELHSYDVNPDGSCVIVLKVSDNIFTPQGIDIGTEIVYRGTKESTLTPLLYEGLVTADGHRLSGRFGDVDTHSGHDILIVARYLHSSSQDAHVPDNPAGDDRFLEGIFVLPSGVASAMRMVVNNETLVGGDTVGGFGLVDMHDNGNFVAQAHPSRVVDSAANIVGGAPTSLGSTLMRGNISSSRLTQATIRDGGRGGPLAAFVGSSAGPTSTYGPRLGPANVPAFVLHPTERSLALYYDGLRIVETGERSHIGNVVLNINPPAFGPDGEIYYVLVTTKGSELYVGNGVDYALLLQTGDRLANDSRPIAGIIIGHTTEHVDPDGRIALITTHDTGPDNLVVGLPL
jgi:hypothetical protein